MSEYIFKLPDLGEGTVEAEIAEWMIKVGDIVQEEDTVCAILTDKAAVELTAPVSGRVTSIAGEAGDTIAVGTPLIIFDIPGKTATIEGKEDHSLAAAGQSQKAAPLPADTGVKTSPSIRRQAREAGIDLSKVRGSGPRGRILQADFEAFLAQSPAPAGPAPAPAANVDAAGTTEIKIIGLRRKIAQHLEQANQEVPHFSYVEEVDITELESLRNQLNSDRAKDEDKLTLLPFICLAMTRVLPQFPQCNAHYDKARNMLIQHQAVHLGIATQTDEGLKVPVVKNAQVRSLDDIALEIRRVSTAARANTAGREELTGSTITLTSLGRLGGVVSTPLINLPEVAIIGVNKALQRPVVLNGQIVIRTMMNLSSSFDHRFVDGHDGASLIQALKQMLEHPAFIFISG